MFTIDCLTLTALQKDKGNIYAVKVDRFIFSSDLHIYEYSDSKCQWLFHKNLKSNSHLPKKITLFASLKALYK